MKFIEEWRDVAQAMAEARLAVYAKARDLRMIDYRAAWERKWAEARSKDAQARRSRFTRVAG